LGKRSDRVNNLLISFLRTSMSSDFASDLNEKLTTKPASAKTSLFSEINFVNHKERLNTSPKKVNSDSNILPSVEN